MDLVCRVRRLNRLRNTNTLNVLITGHTRGLGAALAGHYLAAGERVFGLARGHLDGQPAMLTQQSVDIADPVALSAALATLLPASVRLDIVFLNAGVLGPVARLRDTPLETLREVMDINLWANKLIMDHLAAQDTSPAQVIMLSSGAARRGHYGWGAYALSKAALNMLAQLYAHELPDSHITALAPGLVDTDMQAELRAVDAQAFPSVRRLHEAAGSSAMPPPATAAARIIDCLEALRGRPSGQFVDMREL